MGERPDERTAGFTLVEALVAVSIVSLCLALLVGFVSLGQRLDARSDQLARNAQDLAALDDILGELLGQTVPVIAREGGSDTVPVEGGPRGLSFAAVAPKQFAAAVPLRFRLVLEPGHGVVLTWTQGGNEKSANLMRGAEGALSYRVDGEWRSSFTDLPSLVRLTLWPAGRTVPPFELAWPVRVLRPQSCAVNPRQAWCVDRGR